MNKLTKYLGIGALSLASLVGCNKEEDKYEKMNKPSYECLLEILDNKGNLIRTDTLIYPILFKGSIVFDKNDISGPYTLEGHFHVGSENRIQYHPDK